MAGRHLSSSLVILMVLVVQWQSVSLAGKPFQDKTHFDGFPGIDTRTNLTSISPKVFYIRNNLDGNVEFRESANVSLDVYMSGDAEDKSRFQVVYRLLDNNTVVDIQVYLEPEPLNWPLIGGLAGAGVVVLVVLILVIVCCCKRRNRHKKQEEADGASDSGSRPRSQMIQDKLEVFDNPGLEETPSPFPVAAKKSNSPKKQKDNDKELGTKKQEKGAKLNPGTAVKGQKKDTIEMRPTLAPKIDKNRVEKSEKKGKEENVKKKKENNTETSKPEEVKEEKDKKPKKKKLKENKETPKPEEVIEEKGKKVKERKKDKKQEVNTEEKTDTTPSEKAVRQKPADKAKDGVVKPGRRAEGSVRTGEIGVKDRMKMFDSQEELSKPSPSKSSRASPAHRRPNTSWNAFFLLSFFAVAMAANTLTTPRARIVIHVPSRLVKEGKIFFSDQHHGKVIVSKDWVGRLSIFKQFAVSQATTTVATLAPCSLSCGIACDVNINKCICYRGYQMDGKTCKDINECTTGKHNCHKNATCANTVGSYNCTCAEGMWGDGVTCSPCTTNKPCPEKFYESSKCTRTRDRLCVACGAKCIKTTYQLYGCGLTFDRKCVDISKPLTKAKKGNKTEILATRFGAKILVPNSAHVLMENRLRVKSTNVTFTISHGATPKFTLHRNTGFLVDVEVLETNIAPSYQDYDGSNGHENPRVTSKIGFNEIKTRYCRFPAPNYYELTNKIYSNRQTRIDKETCQAARPDLCPKYTAPGETYHYRTVNHRCHLAEQDAICNTPPHCLLPVRDENVYCTNYVSILDDLFGKTSDQFGDTSLYVFSSPECRLSFITCRSCRRGNCSRCEEGSPDKAKSCSCCFKNCIKPCELFYAGQCGSKREPKKCGRGKTSEFKLVPHYANNLKLRYNCYLKHDEPKTFYKLRYRIREEKGKLTSSWITSSLESSRFGKDTQKAQMQGTNVVDFFEVSHDSNIEIGEEIYLKAVRANAGQPFKYELEDMGEQSTSFPRGAGAKRVQPVNAFSFHVHGGKWKDRGTCNKLNSWPRIMRNDYTKFISPVVRHLRNGGLGEIRYEVFNDTNPPDISFKISNKKSILKFVYNNSTFVNDKSFYRSIKRTNTSWIIELSGKLTGCPSVIGVKVVDEIDHVKVIESDLIFLCPDVKFKFKMDIPRKGLEDKERLFSVYLTDAQQEYKLQAAIVDKTTRRQLGNLDGKGGDKRRSPWVILMPLLVTTGCVIFALIILMIYAQKTAPKETEMEKAWGGYVWVKNKKPNEGSKDPNRLKRRHLILVVFIIVVRIVFSVIVTFSMALAILTLLHAENMKIIQDYRSFVQRKVDESNSIALRMDQFREKEIKSSVDQASDVQRSCDFYLGVQLKWLQFNMSCSLQTNHLKSFNKITNKVIDKVTAEVKGLEKKVKAKVSKFSEATRQGVKNLKDDVERYGRRVADNGWFALPKAVFEIKLRLGKRRKREIGADYMEITDMSHMEHRDQKQVKTLERGLRVLSRMKRSFSDNKFIGFLDFVGAVDQKRVAELERGIKDKLASIKAGFVDFKQAMASGKPPLPPQSTALLCPVRYMSKAAKESLKESLKAICEQSSGGVQASAHCASVNVSNFCSAEDVDDIFGENATDASTSAQRVFYEEKSVDSSQNISAANKSSVITGSQGNNHYNIEKGDATEEQIEKQKEEKLKREGKLKNVTSIYDAEVFTTTRTAIIAVLAVVDILLFVYRSMKTYQVAMKLMYGFEEIVEHDEYEFEEPSTKTRVRNMLNRIFDILAKIFVKFIQSIKDLQKRIVRTNFLPMLVIIAIAAVGFYLTIVLAFNVMNVTVVEELGGFRLISARLDADLAFTNNALEDHMKFINNHDMKLYKQSMQNTLDGYKSVLDDFNAAQRERLEEFSRQLCSIDKDNKSCIPVKPDFPDVSFSSCIFPRFETPKFEEYNGTEYRYKLKYESKKYVDAVRDIFLDTVFFIIAVIIMFILIGVVTVIVFYFLKSRGMVRIRYVHVYPTLPPEVLAEHGLNAPDEVKEKPKEKGSMDGINKVEIPKTFQSQENLKGAD